MTREDNKTFAYSISETQKEINESISSLSEFESTFLDRYQKALKNNKQGIFLSNHEFECTAKLFRFIQAKLFADFQILIDSAKHEKLQNLLLGEMMKDSLLKEFTQNAKVA